MKSLIFTFSIGMFFTLSFCDLENGWKGIKVFESSRADVEKQLGRPIREDKGEVRYETDEARFRFLYSIGPCVAAETVVGGFNLKEGTVLQYEVQPKKEIKIDDLDWDKKLYGRAEDTHQLGYVNYYNRRDGIFIVAQRNPLDTPEIVKEIYFEGAPEQDLKLNCKASK